MFLRFIDEGSAGEKQIHIIHQVHNSLQSQQQSPKGNHQPLDPEVYVQAGIGDGAEMPVVQRTLAAFPDEDQDDEKKKDRGQGIQSPGTFGENFW